MKKQIVAVACDHAGFVLKGDVMEELELLGFTVLNLGTDTEDSVDYPDYAASLAEAIAAGKVEYGVLLCGTGIGISIAANRYSHIRAALCNNGELAEMARKHNNANVLVLGGRVLDSDTARNCVRSFFTTDFEGGRHVHRIRKIS